MFRAAVPDDALPLQDLSKRVIMTNYAPFLGEDTVAAYVESGAVEREIADGLGATTVMLVDGALTGFAVVKADVLHLVMIAPEFQRRGYGSRLLAHIEQQMFAEYPCITLQSFKNNDPANAFYRKNGWDELGGRKHEELDVQTVLFAKRRRLS